MGSKIRTTSKTRTLAQSHPWHGIAPGDDAPRIITCYIEIVPTDVVKYEIDKVSGHLSVDRPNKFSNQCPTLYGFVPRTFCGVEVGRYCARRAQRKKIEGDGDPLDVCVLAERPISHGGVLVQARPIGGFRMIDRGQADDKIIAVLDGDAVYSGWTSIEDASSSLIDRLRHYFLTYKQLPSMLEQRVEGQKVEIAAVYGVEEAHQVIKLSLKDYERSFGD